MRADYIVVGAGSAGCAVASRLSEDPSISVILLEAGERDWYPWIHIPVGYFKTMWHPRFDWQISTRPEASTSGRAMKWPRGKVLGGSSSINGLLYVRGQHDDYNHWSQLGNRGWSWSDVEPVFERMEDRTFDEGQKQRGPLKISRLRIKNKLVGSWIESGVAAGYKANDNYNGDDQEGVGYFDFTTDRGRRCSAAVAYLRPAQGRRNLTVVTSAFASHIKFDGKKASSVMFEKNGEMREATCNREIIVCAGALKSPQLLMLSGIGSASELKAHEIEVLHDSPMVGKRLQDHLQARLVNKVNVSTLNTEMKNPFTQALFGVEYAMYRTGPLTLAASLGTAFLKTDERLDRPDIQFHVQPLSADLSKGNKLHKFSAITVSVCLLRPESMGEVQLPSNDFHDKPAVYANYLATEHDRNTLVEGVKVARKIAECEPMKSTITSEYEPGGDVKSDEDILQWLRDKSVTIYHPVGTCVMGKDDGSVVDEKLRVRGVQGLRVADCSIMPTIVSGNTNGPAIMIGERCADFILAEH